MRFLFLACFFVLFAVALTPTYASNEAVEFYEHIHSEPELGKQEFKTAEFVRHKLTEFGYKDLLTVSQAPTTVIAVLDSEKTGPTICFRAELDARKCDEKSELRFASTIPGVMHNCGHDAHTAILLETAQRLINHRASLHGKIVFLFQPAEETAGGADDIVNDGVLKKLGVQAMFAQHCASGVVSGTHTLLSGPIMAGSNSLSITLSGKGGHAAQPEERDDLAGLSSLVTLELERLPARCMNVVNYPTVCSISTSKWSSEQSNVAPDTITLGGTVRAFYGVDEKLFRGKSFRETLNQLVDGLALAYGVKASTSLKAGSPVAINDTRLCRYLLPLLESAGVKVEDGERAMFSEDFAYYTATIPCAYFGLGIAKGAYGFNNVHSALFTISEDSLDSGVELFVTLAEKIGAKGLPMPADSYGNNESK